MRKILLIALILIAVLAISLGLYFSLSHQRGGRSFHEAYSSAEKLTFSLGEGSVITWEERVLLSYGNSSSLVNRSVMSVMVKKFSWPNFEICSMNNTSVGECGEVFFHMIAFPKELVGVDSIVLPSLLYENLTVLMINEGPVELDLSWGRRGAYNYTNVTHDYPVKNISSATKLYVDREDGKIIRGEVSMFRGNVSLTFVYLLASEPDFKGGFQVEKPDKWNWDLSGSP